MSSVEGRSNRRSRRSRARGAGTRDVESHVSPLVDARPVPRIANATVPVSMPGKRRLRGYAFDPSLSEQLETALINETTYRVRWESPQTSTHAGLMPGPVGEYVEVVDYDPASNAFYAPVDLNAPHLLAQDGLAPSQGNPQFHQQFVYAVVMTTIEHFEQALGRPALWAPRQLGADAPPADRFVQRLRIYPHALRDANAYYSPEKKALLFGYFPAGADRPERYLPGGLVFTCLSHDIIAHETTHALLDGMHRRFIEANHPDALAFHEAFADIVALFQRFGLADVLRHQIRRTRGDLSAPNLLGELAQQFGEAIGNYGALRSAIGTYDEEKQRWVPLKPDPSAYETTVEPHARGAILVAAIFDAFLAIYRSRAADLLRIASQGSGVLPEGELHPDLVNRLANEAAKAARQVLNMCIRALDYCPPVDITFGDYLRALITADVDLVPDDERGYRVAFIEAFRRRGIYPRNVRTLSVESLRWPQVDPANEKFFEPLADKLRSAINQFRYFATRRDIYTRTESISAMLNSWIKVEGHSALKEFSRAAGITFEYNLPGLRGTPPADPIPKFQIYALRPARRVGPDGASLNQLMLSIVQTRDLPLAEGRPERIKFRGGCTLILDLDSMRLRYTIRKDIADEGRLRRHRDYRLEQLEAGSLRATYFRALEQSQEPFAMLHRIDEGGRP